MNVLTTGLEGPEGPVALRDGSWYATEMRRGIVTWISADGTKREVVCTTGRPNGLARDHHGRIWIAESRQRSLMVLEPGGGAGEEGGATAGGQSGGQVADDIDAVPGSTAGEKPGGEPTGEIGAAAPSLRTVSEGAPEVPFLWPNDLCIGPDGYIYMTDSGVHLDDFESIEPPERVYELAIHGNLWRIDPGNGEAEILDSGFRFTNGIAFSPDGGSLYVAETLTGAVYRYDWPVTKPVTSRRSHFVTVTSRPPHTYGRIAGPDGMAVDTDGNLWVAVLTEGAIVVVSPGGETRERFDLEGDFPTNVAFSTLRPRLLVITEVSRGELVTMETARPGAPLFERAEVGS